MGFKLSFFYQQRPQLLSGWSENYWTNESQINQAVIISNNLRLHLAGLHGRETIMPWTRVSNDSNFRQVQLLSFPVGDGINTSVGAGTHSDFPTTAALLEFRSGDRYTVRQWMKGIWDDITLDGGAYTPDGTWLARLNALFTFLMDSGNKIQLRVLNKETVPVQVVQTITAGGVVTTPLHGYNTNDRVRISRAKGLTYANNVWRVTRIDQDTFSLQGWNPPTPIPVYEGNGIVQKQEYVYVPIQAARLVRISKRNVGRPFGLLSGRRRRRS